MKKIIAVVIIIGLSYTGLLTGLRLALIDFLAPLIQINRDLVKNIVQDVTSFSEISKIREENHLLRNKDFVYVSDEYKNIVEKSNLNEYKLLEKIKENDRFFNDYEYKITEVIYLDRDNSKIYINKQEGFKVGDNVTYGRVYLGMIVAENTGKFEVELWNKSNSLIAGFLYSKDAQKKLKVSIRSDNYMTYYVNNILSNEIVVPGDIVVTSSVNTGVIPELYLGEITRVEGISSETFRKAYFNTGVDLESKKFVTLIRRK